MSRLFNRSLFLNLDLQNMQKLFQNMQKLS